jgi:hypothetical protein
MKKQIYVIEDAEGYHFALKYEIEPQLNLKGIEAVIISRKDGNTLTQDLIAGVDVIAIDYDLGGIFGDDIIAEIDSFPEYRSIKILFYSGGEPLESLIEKTRKYGNVICCTKHQLGGKLIDLLVKQL